MGCIDESDHVQKIIKGMDFGISENSLSRTSRSFDKPLLPKSTHSLENEAFQLPKLSSTLTSSSSYFTPGHSQCLHNNQATISIKRHIMPPMRVSRNSINLDLDDEDNSINAYCDKVLDSSANISECDSTYFSDILKTIASKSGKHDIDKIVENMNIESHVNPVEISGCLPFICSHPDKRVTPESNLRCLTLSSASEPPLARHTNSLEGFSHDSSPNKNVRLSACNFQTAHKSSYHLTQNVDSDALKPKKRLSRPPMRVPITETENDNDFDCGDQVSTYLPKEIEINKSKVSEWSDEEFCFENKSFVSILSPETKKLLSSEDLKSATKVLPKKGESTKTRSLDCQDHSTPWPNPLSKLKSCSDIQNDPSMTEWNRSTTLECSVQARTSWMRSACKTQSRCMRPPLRVPVDHVSAELDDKEDDSFDPSSLEVTDLRFQPVLQVTKNQATTYNSHCLNIPANGLMIGMRLFIKHELLGKGGFSMVYRGSSRDIQDCAIKCIDLTDADESTIASYINEVSIMKQLQGCEGIIKLHDDFLDTENKKLYLVMERGEMDLKSFFVNHSKANPDGVSSLIKFCWSQMLTAVNSLHDNGIVHWDLKPANFVIVRGMLKVIDFGISKKVLPDHTSVTSDQIMGTYNYMSPEAFTNLSSEPDGSEIKIKVGPKSDVWSLGCILYSMVYGAPPFQKINNPLQKIMAITSQEISFSPTPLGPTVVQTLKKCLTRDLKSRPSVKDLFRDPFLS